MSDFQTVQDERDEIRYCARVAFEGTPEVGRGNEVSYLRTAQAGATRRAFHAPTAELRAAAAVAMRIYALAARLLEKGQRELASDALEIVCQAMDRA